MAAPFVSTCSTSIRLVSSFFIKHCILHPSFSLSFYLSVPLSLSSLSAVPHPVCRISGFPSGLEMLMFSSYNPKFLAITNMYYPVNTSSDNFHTNAVVPSSDHCRTLAVLPPSGHYGIGTVSPSSDHYLLSSDHCCIETLSPSSDHYGTTKVAPPSDHLNTKRT